MGVARVPLLLLVAGAAACAGGDAPAGGPSDYVVERDTLGDTVVVRTVSGSVWDGPAALVEELRIGTFEGDTVHQFGRVGGLAPDGSGGVYVFDSHVPALRRYDADGVFVRTLGGEGQGPGEYGDAVMGMAVRRDGTLLFRDIRNQRMNLYAPDGTPNGEWRVPAGLFTSDPMRLDTAGRVWAKTLGSMPRPDEPWDFAYIRFGPGGELLDTVRPPTFPGEESFTGGRYQPGKTWTVSPFGEMVAGVTGDYSFGVYRHDGTILRVERDVEPVPVLPEERAELEAIREWSAERARSTGDDAPDSPAIPDFKTLYRQLLAGDRGRLWVRRNVRAEEREVEPVEPDFTTPPTQAWVEPRVYDVFEPDGRYLGEVRFPEGAQPHVVRGDTVWGVQTGEYDEAYVVRWRVRPPEGAGG